MGVKVSLKWPSTAGLMLQNLAHLALCVWVQDKSGLDTDEFSRSVSLSVLCLCIKSICPSHMPTKQDTTISTVKVKRLAPLQSYSPPTLWHYLLASAQRPPPLSAAPSGVTRAGLPPQALALGPTIPAGPCPGAGYPGEKPLAPAPPPPLGLAYAKMLPPPW